MKPSRKARYAAAVTLSKGKMFEFGVPDEDHINIPPDLDLSLQFPLALGTIGEFAAEQRKTRQQAERQRSTPAEEVLFAAQVLIATVDAKVAVPIEEVVRLIAAAAFFLANSPGRALAHSKAVVASSFDDDPIAHALHKALLEPWASRTYPASTPSPVRLLARELERLYQGDSERDEMTGRAESLRDWVYANGTARDLMLGDLLCALAVKRADICAWTLLPKYTGVGVEGWRAYLRRKEAIKDLWPAQQMLGEGLVYSGQSAVVQMPTSAGKTRATELILRASFISKRTALALVVAPFRALCYEIAQDLRLKFRADGVQVNQLSDALQQDYRLDLEDFLELNVESAPHVVVLTPEKLLYVIRQEPTFVANVGLVVYDEGHQFDDAGRGVSYELLLTSLKRALPRTSQTVLISAVIRNSEQLASWLLADRSKVITDKSVQTSRHIAFTTMEHGSDGSLQFDSIIEGEQEFFVPKLVAPYSLNGEQGPHKFPSGGASSMALYLALKLVRQGGAAIFVGKPESASKIIKDAVEGIAPRSNELRWPSSACDDVELDALVRLHEEHFGKQSVAAKGASLGLFSHTGDVPQGIRLSVEHAMREGLISLIVCTSTLAQGVNLPIRYLLVTSPYQSGKLLKTRDFQNLIGRAGRAGMYGDGTVIFTDSKVYDEERKKKKKWSEIQSLLVPEMAAPTLSALLRLVKPLANRFGTKTLPGFDPSYVVSSLLDGEEELFDEARAAVNQAERRDYFLVSDVELQLREKTKTIESIQTFLMAHQESFTIGDEEVGVRTLAEETFAYHLGDENERSLLAWAFQMIWADISGHALHRDVLARYGKGLLGLKQSLHVDAWVRGNLFELQLCLSEREVLDVVWPFVDESPITAKLQRLQPAAARRKLVEEWVEGKSFDAITESVRLEGGFIQWGKQKRKVTVDAVVGYCQNELAFQSCLLVSALAASYSAIAPDAKGSVSEQFEKLGKLLKYGLPREESAALYEAGFSDRVLAQRLTRFVSIGTFGQEEVKTQLRRNRESVLALVSRYPSYFNSVLSGLLR